jgi:hypothetical protein
MTTTVIRNSWSKERKAFVKDITEKARTTTATNKHDGAIDIASSFHMVLKLWMMKPNACDLIRRIENHNVSCTTTCLMCGNGKGSPTEPANDILRQ